MNFTSILSLINNDVGKGSSRDGCSLSIYKANLTLVDW